LARALSRPEDLLRLVDLPVPLANAAGSRSFPQRVPLGYVARMRRGDPADPLLRQVLPVTEEDLDAPGYLDDPVGDLMAMAVPGVLRKYRGRALLVVTGACPVHCRYCFRRHFPYGDAHAARGDWAQAVEHIAGDRSLREVILSGGDPLTLTDERLADLVERISAIAHIGRLRIHTRMPVVLPTRVDKGLLGWLGATRLRNVVVIHANHPNEIDDAVAQALARLQATGAGLLNQSVLLRGVNDDPEVLAGLSERLFEVGVLPYYLHRLDRVRGAAHFEVDDARAGALMAEIRTRLPGYLVPRLVREEAGAPFKLPMG